MILTVAEWTLWVIHFCLNLYMFIVIYQSKEVKFIEDARKFHFV